MARASALDGWLRAMVSVRHGLMGDGLGCTLRVRGERLRMHASRGVFVCRRRGRVASWRVGGSTGCTRMRVRVGRPLGFGAGVRWMPALAGVCERTGTGVAGRALQGAQARAVPGRLAQRGVGRGAPGGVAALQGPSRNDGARARRGDRLAEALAPRISSCRGAPRESFP
jgi:hypothetical protein